MNGADYHAMGRASMALTDGKNELIRAGCGSELTIRLMRDAAEALERSAITCNKNGIPFDPLPPVKTSGIRVGSPAGTTRGFGIAEFEEIGDMVADVLEALRDKGEHGDADVEADVRGRVRTLCERFPIYQG